MECWGGRPWRRPSNSGGRHWSPGRLFSGQRLEKTVADSLRARLRRFSHLAGRVRGRRSIRLKAGIFGGF